MSAEAGPISANTTRSARTGEAATTAPAPGGTDPKGWGAPASVRPCTFLSTGVESMGGTCFGTYEGCTEATMTTTNSWVSVATSPLVFCNSELILFLCSDINECETKDVCQHECLNTPGSHRCLCPAGYRLMANRKTCQGRNHLLLPATLQQNAHVNQKMLVGLKT